MNYADVCKAISKAIKSARTDAKMTQAELAQKIGKGTSTVQKYEMGIVEPNMDTIIKIAEALSVPVETLLGLSPMTVSVTDVYQIELPEPRDIDPDISGDQVPICRRLTRDLLEKSGRLTFEDKKAVIRYVEYLLHRTKFPDKDDNQGTQNTHDNQDKQNTQD